MTSCIQGNHSTIGPQIQPVTTIDWLADLYVPVERTMSHKVGDGEVPEVAALHLTRFRPKSLDHSSHSYLAEPRLVILLFKICFLLYMVWSCAGLIHAASLCEFIWSQSCCVSLESSAPSGSHTLAFCLTPCTLRGGD